MRHRIELEGSGEVFECESETTVLRAMEVLGRRGIPMGCRGGGCGVCKVQVMSGDYQVRRMSRACVSESEQAQGVVLACQLRPLTDLDLRVVGRMRRAWDKKKNLDKK